MLIFCLTTSSLQCCGLFFLFNLFSEGFVAIVISQLPKSGAKKMTVTKVKLTGREHPSC